MMPYRAHLRLTVLAFAAAGWHGAAAAEPAPAIVEVVGTTPLPGLAVARSRIPANVQALDGDAVNAPGAATLPDALNRRLGSVYVNEIQGNPFQPDVNYRGFTASPLLGTPQGLSVYVDGVRMNQPFGDVVSWDLIPRAAIASLVLVPGSKQGWITMSRSCMTTRSLTSRVGSCGSRLQRGPPSTSRARPIASSAPWLPSTPRFATVRPGLSSRQRWIEPAAGPERDWPAGHFRWPTVELTTLASRGPGWC